MPDLSIKNPPDEMVKRLEEGARRHHRSLQATDTAQVAACIVMQRQR